MARKGGQRSHGTEQWQVESSQQGPQGSGCGFAP